MPDRSLVVPSLCLQNDIRGCWSPVETPNPSFHQPKFFRPLKFDGDMPAGTEYILDMTFMSKYAVRDPFCRYGGAAFFNAEREVLGAKDASSFTMPFDTKSDHCYMIVPRRARDDHRERHSKGMRFSQRFTSTIFRNSAVRW